MPLPLLALFFAAFAFGTTEFVIAGVLPQVADGLGVSIPNAGYLVSGYAIGVAVGGPLLTIATGRMARKTLLVWLLVGFTAGQFACALAPDFVSMLGLRVAIAVLHGVYFGVAMVVGIGLVRPEQRGMAVALILAGLTVSGIIGVPLGTAIGTIWGWRATFWAMFVLGVISTIAMALLLPPGTGTVSAPAGLRNEVRVLGRQQVWTCLIIMLMLMLCQFVPYTYITPLLQEVTGIAPATVPWVLLLCGIGSTLGVFIGGRLTARHLLPTLMILPALQAVTMVVIYLVSPFPLLMIAALFVWSGINFAIGTPIQTRILSWTADAPNLASSLIPSGFNVGIAIAASVGAVMLNAGFDYRSLPLVGIVSMIVATLVAIGSTVWEKRSGAMPPGAIQKA